MLNKPDDKFINVMLIEYSKVEGHQLNEKLQKLFDVFNDNTNKHDVMIKVAALNKIYATAITNINPVVNKICSKSLKFNPIIESDYITFVDEISSIEWTNANNETFKRNNLSFASKYVHFLSNRLLPIYDSYIWIVMKAYLAKAKGNNVSFASPNNYAEFFNTFIEFKMIYNLDKYSNYDLDKFLWSYGKNLIKEIEIELSINLDKAKAELKKRLKAKE